MESPAASPIMLAMTRPTKSSKVVLVEDRRSGSEGGAGTPLRRYRLARLRLEGRSHDPVSRYEHLERVHD
jgi:hypothetical protein